MRFLPATLLIGAVCSFTPSPTLTSRKGHASVGSFVNVGSSNNNNNYFKRHRVGLFSTLERPTASMESSVTKPNGVEAPWEVHKFGGGTLLVVSAHILLLIPCPLECVLITSNVTDNTITIHTSHIQHHSPTPPSTKQSATSSSPNRPIAAPSPPWQSSPPAAV
jgi:hypothetical protein